MFVPEEREWLRLAVESGRFRPPVAPIDIEALLDRITEVETFERFLHRTFPGKTRFSIEGLDMLVPILDEVIDDATDAGLRHVLIGMAHRGRLNVLAHVLGKPYEQILAEFKDPVQTRTGYRIDLGWTGDVKYHAGALRKVDADDRGLSCRRTRATSSSSNPVVAGMARAAGTDAGKPGSPVFDADRSLPMLIHGDSAFPGQGVVAETLNLSRLDGLHDGRHDPHHRQQPAGLHGRCRRSRTRPRTRAAWPAASRFRSSTSTPTTRSRASRRRAWPGPTARASSATS